MYYFVLFFGFFPSFLLIRLNAFLPCKIVKNPQKYTIYITWLYVKCQLTEKLKKQSIQCRCALLLCSLRFHEKSKNESVHSWRPFVKRHALALLLRFSLWFFSLSCSVSLCFSISHLFVARSPFCFTKHTKMEMGFFSSRYFLVVGRQHNKTQHTTQHRE